MFHTLYIALTINIVTHMSTSTIKIKIFYERVILTYDVRVLIKNS